MTARRSFLSCWIRSMRLGMFSFTLPSTPGFRQTTAFGVPLPIRNPSVFTGLNVVVLYASAFVPYPEGVRYRSPFLPVAVEQLPRLRDATVGFHPFIVEPINLDLGDLDRLVEIVLGPFFRPAVVPPGESGDGVVARVVRLDTVVEGGECVSPTAVGSRGERPVPS